MNDIKRKTELFLCAWLKRRVPEVKFLPSKGGTEVEGQPETDSKPESLPYCVIEAIDAERRHSDMPLYLVTMAAIYITHIDDTEIGVHSAAVKKVQDALATIPRGRDTQQDLIVHGSDITGTDSAEDSEKQSHADVVGFTLAVSG